MKKRKVQSTNFAALKMAELQLKAKERQTLEIKQRPIDFQRFIDPAFDYSPTLADFMEEINSIYPSRGKEYVLFLRQGKKKYANASYFYNQYCSSKTEETLLDAYRAILGFISSELETAPVAVSGNVEKLSVPAVALLCFYSGRKITKTNAELINQEYGHKSGTTLYIASLKYDNQSERINCALVSSKAKTSLLGYYTSILPILKEVHPTGFASATKAFETLKRTYSKEYDKHFATQ